MENTRVNVSTRYLRSFASSHGSEQLCERTYGFFHYRFATVILMRIMIEALLHVHVIWQKFLCKLRLMATIGSDILAVD